VNVRNKFLELSQPKSLHTRFIHMRSQTHSYYALSCAASVPMSCGSI